MTCEELRAYLDTTLLEDRTDEMLAQVERHTGSCPSCTKYMAGLAQTERQLRTLPPIQAESEVLEAVMACITGQEPAPATSGETVSERLRLPVLVMSVLIAAAAWYRATSVSECFLGMWTVHLRLGGFGSSQLLQPPLVTVLCGIAAVLAAMAILWPEPPQRKACVA